MIGQVKEEIANGEAILLDVREQDEWEEDHITNAYHIPLSRIQQSVPHSLPNDKTIYIHCRLGGRAEQAALLLKTEYPSVIPLRYPFEELKEKLEN